MSSRTRDFILEFLKSTIPFHRFQQAKPYEANYVDPISFCNKCDFHQSILLQLHRRQWSTVYCSPAKPEESLAWKVHTLLPLKCLYLQLPILKIHTMDWKECFFGISEIGTPPSICLIWGKMEGFPGPQIDTVTKPGLRVIWLDQTKSLLPLFNASYTSDTVNKGCLWSLNSDDSECVSSGSRSGL